ncbi:MAG: SRPBCC family protein [Actinomycetota bacterium]|nr:SRPBCC family protein [Actinomycetota bacterium]
MALVRVRTAVPESDCTAALRLVTDYRRWPEAADSVRSVVVEEQGDGSSISFWEVTFRGGVMKWSERDRIDADANVQTFELIEGDPHAFSGTWRAAPLDQGCLLTMDAEFDLGMPSVSHVIDPIAIEALEDAIGSVVRGLFGEDVEISFGEEAAAPARADHAPMGTPAAEGGV